MNRHNAQQFDAAKMRRIYEETANHRRFRYIINMFSIVAAALAVLAISFC